MCTPLQNTLRTSVLPDYLGNALKTVTAYTVGQTSYVAETVNTYDDRGRVLTSTTTAQGASAKTTYAYDALGRVKGADYGPALGTAILTVRDSVNIQGFRTESTASLAGGGNVYSQTLRYFNPQKGTTARFSGTVSEWLQNQGTESDTYGFAYDAAGRLTAGTRYAGSSTTGAASFTERGISYDKAGGMLAIQRYGQNASTPEDNLTLTYNGMKLASVTGTIGSQSVNAAFTYDACGRTLTDGVSKLNYQYNLLGALTAVADAGTLTPTTLSTYRHLADGTKYMTVSSGNNGALLYRGPLTFTIADVTAATPAISFLRAETGSTGAAIIANASGSGAAPYFYVTDQLGSVRAVVDSQGSVVERNDYYTYGKRHTTGRTYADLKNSPLLFSGKEDQGQALDLASGATTPSNLRILDFGARHYDPIVPRWTTPDPLAEKYFPINPYAYCAGDPVRCYDPDGMDWVDANGNKIKDHTKIKAYIFYDPREEGKGFAKQSKEMYKQLETKYGKGSVAMSNVTTEKEFVQDWSNMASGNIIEVNLNYHGNNQTIILDAKEGEYITATGNGESNRSETPATNVQDLPTPSGDISNAQLNINTCKSNSKTQYTLKGSKQTLMEAFFESTNFKIVRGTSSGVSYDRKTLQPFPGHSWKHGTWDYMRRPGPVSRRYPRVGLPPK